MPLKHNNVKKFTKNGKNTKKRRPIFKEKPKQTAAEDGEISQLKAAYSTISPKSITSFSDFPLSKKTQKGLQDCEYKTPTAIQKESIGYALQGRDVLGAAITGSGKTLAFLVPVMENLFAQKWSRMDGVGAIIISPTRELAYQIFETLKKIGKCHDFSAGLIIGGKNLKFERSRMDQCNVIICTPGRLLQHMDENPLFNCTTMQVLVLDEADRCLDMGFQQTMNAIIENLPPDRQTLLFSATQTKSVKDLARLSLKDPVYVAPHEQAQHSTPDSLQQNYVVVDLEDKITMLWSFIKNHLKQKTIVFLSSCKQVKYIYEIFCKLRPGTSVIALYGTLHQDRRMAIYNEFCRKSNVVLFATDIASRGLDFPIVNWVIQLDCPEDATAYIHRAGRTARHKAHGESLLVLMPSEEAAMVDELQAHKIPINKIHIDPKRLFSPRAKMEGFLAQNQALKESAQRAFIAYIKSVVLMKNKRIFNVDALDTDAYARSLGLVVAPRVRFLQRLKKNAVKKEPTVKQESASKVSESDNSDSDDDEEDDAHNSNPTTIEKDKADFNLSSEDEDDGLFKIKRRDHEIEENELPDKIDVEASRKKVAKQMTKAALAKRVIKKKIQANTRVYFDESGAEIVDANRKLQSELAKKYEENNEDGGGGIDIDQAKLLLKEEDKFDKQRFRQLLKARHKELKNKSKQNDDEQDDFGSDEEESDTPDLSWLPDPDKVYALENPSERRLVVNSSDESSDGDDDDDDEEEIHRPPKTLLTKRTKQSNEDEPTTKKSRKFGDKLTVDEAELLAMRLLEDG